jgi:hypothetical protein
MTEITRCDVLVDDPETVFDWLRTNMLGRVVRKMAYETVLGWHIKIALEGQDAADCSWVRWSNDDAARQAETRRARLLSSIRKERHGPSEYGAAPPA